MDPVRLDKKELAEAAIESATEVLKEILAYAPTRGQMQIIPIQFTRDDVTVVTRVSGDLSAELFIGFARSTADAILKRMLKSRTAGIGALERSALSELGGLVADKALSVLEEKGALCYATWSGVICGREERATPYPVPSLSAPLRLVVGEVNLNVLLQAYAPYSWASPEARLSALRKLGPKMPPVIEPVPIAA